ncbi:MAG: FAD-dependent oxidoreductase [Acidobacteria bacterium]|nr:FAD-dependent oxidoreductase [Acidobacteriota bacterium]
MILVLGGGLAGLSAAYHLARELPGVPRLVLEREAEPGGLCRSRRADGFTFDLTGHYLHLRDPETVALVDELLGGELVPVERRAVIHCRGTIVDFPFQAHLHGLPPDVVARCLVDFVEASRSGPPDKDPRMPFGAWARAVFGDGIAEEFLLPFNAKQFGVPPDELTAEWVAWSVPRPDLRQVVGGALGLKNPALGYNPRFHYPRSGGIGVLASALAERVGADLRLGARVTSIDAHEHRVVLEGGEILHWERLVSTLPLPALLQRTRGLGSCPRLGRSPAEMAGELRWSAVIDLQIGVERREIAGGAHWMYFPGPEYPFYRVGFPANVAPAMAPAGCRSLSVEFPHRPGAPLPGVDELLAAAREGLVRAGVLGERDRVVHAERVLLDPAYVIFDRRRTPTVAAAEALLHGAGIRAIGRFGGWTYSYMERALIDGRDVARELAAELR